MLYFFERFKFDVNRRCANEMRRAVRLQAWESRRGEDRRAEERRGEERRGREEWNRRAGVERSGDRRSRWK